MYRPVSGTIIIGRGEELKKGKRKFVSRCVAITGQYEFQTRPVSIKGYYDIVALVGNVYAWHVCSCWWS